MLYLQNKYKETAELYQKSAIQGNAYGKWCLSKAHGNGDDEDEKFTISFETVVHNDKCKFNNKANNIFETAYFYVYNSNRKRIALSPSIDSFIFFSRFGGMMMKYIEEHHIFELDENGILASIRNFT